MPDIVIPNGGTTDDQTPEIRIITNAPLWGGASIHILRNGVDIGVATEISPTEFSFTDNVADGAYSYTAELRFNTVQEASQPYAINVVTSGIPVILPVPARLGWGTFAFDGTSGTGANLEFVNGRVDAVGYNADITQSAKVSSVPNVYGRLASPTTCAFGLVEDDGETYTIRVEYGPPGYDINSVQFPASTLNATTCPVTWDGQNGVMTLPTMDKPCTGVLGKDNDVRIYLVRNGVDVGYLLMNVVDVPNYIWDFQVPVWFAYTSL